MISPGPSAATAVLPEYRRADLPIADTSLSPAYRLHLALTGFVIALAAFALCAALALLIAAGPFHTSLGSFS